MALQMKKAIILIAKIVFTISLIYLVASKIDFREFWLVLSKCNPLLLIVAIAFFIFSKIISSLRLNLFFRSMGLMLSEKFNLRLYWLGMYYNLFLPGGIGGDGYKVYLLNREKKASIKEMVTTLLLDRVTGLLALFILLIILSYFVPFPKVVKYWAWGLIPLSELVFYGIIRKFFPNYVSVFHKTNALSFGVQFSQLITAFFILIAMHQFSQLSAYLFLFLISSVVAVIPFTLGGIGAREITFLTGAELLNLNVHISVAVSMIFFLITAIVSLWGIRYSFVKLN